MAEFTETDRRILAAINAVSDPDAEKSRERDETDNYDLPPPISVTSTQLDLDDHKANNPKLARIIEDQKIRQHTNTSGPRTGPKGVLADYRFHAQQEITRREEAKFKEFKSRNNTALSSGWLQRQIANEEAEKKVQIARAEGGRSSKGKWKDEEREKEEYEDSLEELERQVEDIDIGDPSFIAKYQARRVAELSCNRVFGILQELDESNYVSAIDSEPNNVSVVVHLYQPTIETCRITNTYLTQLARKYGLVKFCKILSTRADEDFDCLALPALLVYCGGSLTHTLIRITDEISGWRSTGRIDMEDFEEYLIRHQVLKESQITDYNVNEFSSKKKQYNDDDDDEDFNF